MQYKFVFLLILAVPTWEEAVIQGKEAQKQYQTAQANEKRLLAVDRSGMSQRDKDLFAKYQQNAVVGLKMAAVEDVLIGKVIAKNHPGKTELLLNSIKKHQFWVADVRANHQVMKMLLDNSP